MNRFTIGRLFEPMTQSFNDKVKTVAFRVFGKMSYSSWIGISRKGGHWIYTTSGTKLKFQDWAPNQPNTAGARKDYNCGLIDLSKELQIVYRLFLVNCYLLHVPRLPSQPASNVGGLVIH